MAGGNPDLVVRIAANITALQADMATAAGSIKIIEAATTSAAAASAGWTSALTDLGHSFVARVAEGMLLRDAFREFLTFGREVLTAGSSIQKMADQTSIGTAEIQKLMYIAGQSDVSIESLVGAVQNLQVRLGDETTGAAGALAKLRISADTFNKLDTYTQMTTLGAAINALPAATEQASVGAALFGKTWKEILPAIKSGMQEVGDQAPIMADSTIKSLDRTDDSLKALHARAITWGGGFVLAIEEAAYAVGDFLSRFSPEHFGVANSALLELEYTLNDPDGIKRAFAAIPKVVTPVAEAFHALKMSATDVKIAELELTASAKASIVVHEQEAKAAAEAARIEAAALEHTTKLWDDYFELRAAHGGTANQIAIAQIDKWAADLTAQMIKAKTDTTEFYDALAAVSKEKLDAVGIDWDQWKTKSIDALNETRDNALHTLNAMIASGQFLRDDIDAQRAKYEEAAAAARGYGKDSVAAHEAAAKAAEKQNAILEAQKKAIEAAAAAERNRAMGNTLDIAHAARDPEIMELLKAGWSLENAEAIKLGRQYGFQAKLYSPKGELETTPDRSERVPGYQRGGPTVEGPAYLHAQEYVVPHAGALVLREGGGAGVTNHIVINVTHPFGTPAEIGRRIDEALCAHLRSHGFRF